MRVRGLHFSVNIKTNIQKAVKGLCQTRKVVVVGYPPIGYIFNTRHNFLLAEGALNPRRELLATSKIHMPLLDPSGFCAMQVIVVVHQYDRGPPSFGSLYGFMKTFLQGGGFQVRSTLDLLGPCLKHIGTYFQFLRGDQGQWQQPIMFPESLRLP